MFIKASVLRQILYSVSENETELNELLLLTKLPSQNIADADIEIDWKIGQELWSVVERFTKDVNIGLKVGANTPVEATGLVGMLAQSSPTVEKAWDEITKFSMLFTDMMNYHSERNDQSFSITFEPAVEWRELNPRTARHAISQSAIATLKIFSALCRKKLVPKVVCFAFEEEANSEEYDQAFGVPISYGMKTNCLIFNEKVADYNIVSYASEVYISLQALCQSQLNDNRTKDKSLKSEVGKLIIEGLDKGGCNLNEIAHNLNLSERTLQRKLAKEGVRFKDYYNEIRMSLAKKLLENSRYNVSEIAEQLGYIELSSFRKMFAQTFGQNPKQYQIEQSKH